MAAHDSSVGPLYDPETIRKEHRLPEDTLVHIPANQDWLGPLDLKSLFTTDAPIHLELGAGDGSFLLQYASAHPELNFLAVERLLGRLRKIDKKGRKAGLRNMRAMRVEADYLVRYLIPKESLDAVHIYFPDPWPKKKHHKNRLIQPDFVASLHKCLKLGGHLYLRTDNVPYFNHMEEVMSEAKGYTRAETPDELKSVVTDFEVQWTSQGIPTNHSSWIAE